MHKSQDVRAIQRVARLVRASRKQSGLSQQVLADLLELEQSALSRIENGKQMLLAPQFIKLCEITGIPGNSLISGYIEFAKPVTLDQETRIGDFKIPKRYGKLRGSKVRAALPFLNYFAQVHSESELRKYLKFNKMDPDYFINLDNQININFCLDISRHLIQSGHLNRENLANLVKPVNQPHMHGRLHYHYDVADSTSELMQAVFKQAKNYETNFDYQIEHSDIRRIEISITPKEHMKAFQYKNDTLLGDFLCSYKKSYFSRFANYGGKSEAKVKELQCHYQGHSKCVYQLETGI